MCNDRIDDLWSCFYTVFGIESIKIIKLERSVMKKTTNVYYLLILLIVGVSAYAFWRVSGTLFDAKTIALYFLGGVLIAGYFCYKIFKIGLDKKDKK